MIAHIFARHWFCVLKIYVCFNVAYCLYPFVYKTKKWKYVSFQSRGCYEIRLRTFNFRIIFSPLFYLLLTTFHGDFFKYIVMDSKSRFVQFNRCLLLFYFQFQDSIVSITSGIRNWQIIGVTSKWL